MIDLLDSSPHPYLSAHFIRLFSHRSTHPRDAQLIFTGHDATLLGRIQGEEVLKRDHVRFTERNEYGEPELFTVRVRVPPGREPGAMVLSRSSMMISLPRLWQRVGKGASLTREMVRAAENCEVRLALSTPRFELWLLLHHVGHGKPFQSAESAKKPLKDVVPTWSEGATKYADFAHGVETVCRRARKLHPDDDDPLKNPSTGVWRLVESLRYGSASN
ncbi:RloB domain-containing protein [Sphaerisporangium sp. NPDC005288]|uniref:RloB domain-containing protein n=1 Tax=Sphaerisporangium sp. NPDC005288 TaxID=3155114 RepID=UPI0033B7554D